MSRFEWHDDGYFVTEQRDLSQIRRVLVVTMILNFLATAIKLTAGFMTGALSIVADGLDSLFDALSNLVGLAGLYIAGKPPDAEHPYGHRKFETIAALSISFLLFLTSIQLLETAWQRWELGKELRVNLWTVAAMLVSMLIQAATSFYELGAGRRLHSEILVADALHTRASILVSFSVLVGLGFVWLGYPLADPILAAGVALVIAKIGLDILRQTIPVLVDRAAVDPRRIAKVVNQVDGVSSFHRVRSRGAEGSAAVDLHVRISPEKTVQEADAIASEVRRRLLEQDGINDVTVHMEAQRDGESSAQDIFSSLKQAATELGLTIHESWAHRLDGRLYLEIHVGVDPALTLGEAHRIVDRLEREMRLRVPQLDEVHTHIEMADHQVQDVGRVTPELEQKVHQEVRQLVDSIPSLNEPHNIIIRRYPETGNYYLSLECTVAPETPVATAHQLSTLLERELSRRLEGVVEVFVHLEPPDS